MDGADISLEEKCENLMNVVVESRKVLGKMCISYEDKCHIVENKLFKLQLDTIANFSFKPKNPIPQVDVEDMNKDLDNFAVEILEKQKRLDSLRRSLKNTQDIVLQLKNDKVGCKLRKPLTAESILEEVKAKKAKIN